MLVKSEPPEPKPLERSLNVAKDVEEAVINSIKIENIDISDNEDEEKSSDIVDTDTVQPYQIGTENAVARPSLLSGTTTAGSLSLNSISSEIDSKYCHVCDIKFKYMSSYMAHKKSYCRNIQSEIEIGAVASNQATSVISTTRSSPSQTSVVT